MHSNNLPSHFFHGMPCVNINLSNFYVNFSAKVLLDVSFGVAERGVRRRERNVLLIRFDAVDSAEHSNDAQTVLHLLRLDPRSETWDDAQHRFAVVHEHVNERLKLGAELLDARRLAAAEDLEHQL